MTEEQFHILERWIMAAAIACDTPTGANTHYLEMVRAEAKALLVTTDTQPQT